MLATFDLIWLIFHYVRAFMCGATFILFFSLLPLAPLHIGGSLSVIESVTNQE